MLPAAGWMSAKEPGKQPTRKGVTQSPGFSTVWKTRATPIVAVEIRTSARPIAMVHGVRPISFNISRWRSWFSIQYALSSSPVMNAPCSALVFM